MTRMNEGFSNAESPVSQPRPRRRWLQYSLRSLSILFVLAAIGMAWLATVKKSAERQKLAVEAIVKGGGSVGYDYQFRTFPSGTSYIDNATPPGPAWLRRLLGDDFFTNVVEAGIVTRPGLDQLTQLPKIQRLELEGLAVVDSTLDQLKDLNRLDGLCLKNTSITDKGMEKLAELTQIKSLELYGNVNVTDDGLKGVSKLTHLEFFESQCKQYYGCRIEALASNA